MSRRYVSQRADVTSLGDLVRKRSIELPLASLAGGSVLISCRSQLPAVAALLQLDGIAKRVLLCPPDLPSAYLPAVLAEAGVSAIVSDGTGPAGATAAGQTVHDVPVIGLIPGAASGASTERGAWATEWLLFTSGTTGRPKIVIHTLPSLTGPLDDGLVVANNAVWSTFYDIRRYGGLQILLRALLGGGSMVLSHPGESVGQFLVRAGESGVTHISGTPSHWRRALMSPEIALIDPAYVRLSGEVADQAILNRLAAAFPKAEVAHAFASTEAGVAFDVRDGLAGFPASLIGQTGGKAEMRVEDGSLRIRSKRTALGYLGGGHRLADEDGFVDTGDMVELLGSRYYFVGRREGIINVGGQKVHPEEVEAVINQHPSVQMSRVRGRRSPITGAIVVADILLRPDARLIGFETIRHEIQEACGRILPAHKVPAMLYEVGALHIGESGKLARRDA